MKEEDRSIKYLFMMKDKTLRQSSPISLSCQHLRPDGLVIGKAMTLVGSRPMPHSETDLNSTQQSS